MNRIVLVLLSLALPSQAAVAAEEKSCLTPEEGQRLITSFLPDLIQTAAESCRPALPENAFLLKSASSLETRYKAEADNAWKLTRPILGKIMGKEVSLFAKLDDETMRKVMASGVADRMAGSIKGKDCITVSGVLEALEPLPPANLSKLITIIFEGMSRDRKAGSGSFQICPAPAAVSQ